MLTKKSLLLLPLIGSLCFVGMLHADVTSGIPVVVNIGRTNDPYVSYLVIDDTSLGNSAIEYAWYYSSLTETDGVTPLNGSDLIDAVVNGTTNNLDYALTPITEGGGGVDAGVEGFQIGGQTSTVVSVFDSSATAYWAYWIKGGSQTASYYPYETVTPSNWTIALDTPLYRTLTNGSSDGWTLSTLDSNFSYNGPAPLSSAALVPESGAMPLLLLSAGTLFLVLRCKPLTRNSKS